MLLVFVKVSSGYYLCMTISPINTLFLHTGREPAYFSVWFHNLFQITFIFPAPSIVLRDRYSETGKIHPAFRVLSVEQQLNCCQLPFPLPLPVPARKEKRSRFLDTGLLKWFLCPSSPPNPPTCAAVLPGIPRGSPGGRPDFSGQGPTRSGPLG